MFVNPEGIIKETHDYIYIYIVYIYIYIICNVVLQTCCNITAFFININAFHLQQLHWYCVDKRTARKLQIETKIEWKKRRKKRGKKETTNKGNEWRFGGWGEELVEYIGIASVRPKWKGIKVSMKLKKEGKKVLDANEINPSVSWLNVRKPCQT